MNTNTLDSQFNSNKKTVIIFVYNVLMSNTLLRSTTTWNSTKTFIFPLDSTTLLIWYAGVQCTQLLGLLDTTNE